MNITACNFLILSIIKDNITVLKQNASASSDLLVRCEERLQIGLINCEFVLGAVLKDERLRGGGNVKDDRGFLSDTAAVGLGLDDEVDNGGDAR